MQCCHKLLIVEKQFASALQNKKEETRGHYTVKVHKAIYMTPSIYLCFIVYEQSLISNKDIMDGVM